MDQQGNATRQVVDPAHVIGRPGLGGVKLADAPNGIARQWAEGELGRPATRRFYGAEWRGRVAVLNDPSIGMQDVGNAAVAAGMMQFEDLGNMTQEEIDGLIKILLDLKGKGQFRAFWTTFDESVTLMQSGEVVIESMWSPAVALLQSSGHPTRYAAPAGGFRGWVEAGGDVE